MNDILFSECKFIDNESKTSTPNIYINNAANVKIDNCLFLNSIVPQIGEEWVIETKGNFIQIIAESSVIITDSTFKGGYAY